MADAKTGFSNLRIKIAIYILVGALVFSSVVIFFTSDYLDKTLTDSYIKQGQIVGQSIGEMSAEQLIDEDWIGLKTILEKYRYSLNNEYILIADVDYNIVADSYNGNVPVELTNAEAFQKVDEGLDSEYLHNLIQVGAEEIHDIILPIREGGIGFVRLGLKKSFVDREVRKPLIFIGLIIGIAVIAAIIIALMIITVQVTRPVIHLAEAAEQISLGNFDTPVKLTVKNELQILAAAIDRMRESLKTSLDRLKSRSTIGRF